MYNVAILLAIIYLLIFLPNFNLFYYLKKIDMLHCVIVFIKIQTKFTQFEISFSKSNIHISDFGDKISHELKF